MRGAVEVGGRSIVSAVRTTPVIRKEYAASTARSPIMSVVVVNMVPTLLQVLRKA